MGAMFAKAGSAKEEERLSLPKMIHYSKLASSNITQLMTETNDQISTNPVKTMMAHNQNHSYFLFYLIY